MAKIAPPKKKKAVSTKGLPPTSNEASKNLDKPTNTELKPMNFKVENEFHKEFKGFAVDHDMSMVELLKAAFDFYKQNH